MKVEPSSTRHRSGVIAAIMGGVAAYIEEEERAQQATRASQSRAVAVKLWSIMGRVEMMRMRSMWQRRIVG
jgi:hypothetical protein